MMIFKKMPLFLLNMKKKGKSKMPKAGFEIKRAFTTTRRRSTINDL